MEPINKYEIIDNQRAIDAAVSSFMTKVYGWMSLALFLTAFTAWFVSTSEATISFIFGNSGVLGAMLIAQLALVFVISGAINKLSTQIASILFVLYSMLTGATLSVIFLVYTAESIAATFGITGLTFGIISIYGFFTKKDLSGWRSILMIALIGLIIASVVNLFFANSTLYWIISYAGVLIFAGLTAYDTQKLKNLSAQVEEGEMGMRLSILGALTLYLNLINMFLYLLRFLGKRE